VDILEHEQLLPVYSRWSSRNPTSPPVIVSPNEYATLGITGSSRLRHYRTLVRGMGNDRLRAFLYHHAQRYNQHPVYEPCSARTRWAYPGSRRDSPFGNLTEMPLTSTGRDLSRLHSLAAGHDHTRTAPGAHFRNRGPDRSGMADVLEVRGSRRPYNFLRTGRPPLLVPAQQPSCRDFRFPDSPRDLFRYRDYPSLVSF